MSREDMSEMLLEQKALSAFGASNAKDLDAAVKKEYEQVKALEKQGKFADAEVIRQKIINKLGSDEKITQLDNKSIAEMQALAAQKTIEAFTILTPLLEKVKKIFEIISANAQTTANILGVIGGLLLFDKFFKLAKVFKGLVNGAKSIAKFLGIGAKSSEKVTAAVMKTGGNKIYGAAAKAAVKAGTATVSKVATKEGTKIAGKEGTKIAAKTGSKFLAKGLLKRIPIIGSLVGLGFAVDRLIKGDITGAALETGSAALGLLDLAVPGLGTGLSLAADAGIAARDFKNAGTITPGESKPAKPMATGGIVTGPTRALVGEAGPEAVIPLDKLYAKFDQLIKATQQGKDVSLNLSGFRVQ